MRRKLVQASGGKRMIQLGMKPIQLWLTNNEKTTLEIMAGADHRPVTEFCLQILRPIIKEFQRAAAEMTPAPKAQKKRKAV